MNNSIRVFALLALTLSSSCQSAAIDTQRNIDLIVDADFLLTMADKGYQENQAVAIDDGRIVAIDSQDVIHTQFVASTVIDGTDRIVMPGLINGHTHAAMSLMRGVADDLELMTWLTRYIFPAELALVDESFIRTGTALACWEMIRGGTTTFVDMYFFPDTVSQTVVDCGLRAIVVPSVIEQASPDAEDFEQSLSQAIRFVKDWQGRHPRITPAIGAHSVYTISEPALKRIIDAAKSLGAPISIHVAESPFEMQTTEAQYGRSPVALLDDLGFLDVTLIAAHVVHGDVNDWQRMAGRQVGAVHNPTSNLKLASGISPVVDMRAEGVKVGLGTDGAASNNDLDMWEEIRLAALLAKGVGMDPTRLPAFEALSLATKDGAEAIGQQSSIGTLEIGKQADLIQVAIDDLSQAPMYDPVSHLAYVADEHDVVTTIVNGAVLMRNREILSIDEDTLREAVAAEKEKIASLVLTPESSEEND
ncbi:MAG: amidohydrolase family protein [Pseudomonadota bacterium]